MKSKLEQIYDVLFDEADKLMKEYNPCQITDGECINTRYADTKSCCCYGCKYLTPNGCSAKSLFCRLWTCAYLEPTLSDEFKSRQEWLYNAALSFGLLHMRGSKQDHLNTARQGNPINEVDLAEGLSVVSISFPRSWQDSEPLFTSFILNVSGRPIKLRESFFIRNYWRGSERRIDIKRATKAIRDGKIRVEGLRYLIV